MKNKDIILFFIFFKYSNLYIVLPFRLNEYVPKIEGQPNVTDLINQILVVDMFTTIDIGSTSSIQKVTTLITPDENLLSLSSNVCKRKSLDAINDYSIVSKKSLDLSSSSYDSNIIKKSYTDYLNEDNKIGVIKDTISMYNTTYLGCQPIEIDYKKEKDTKISVNDIPMPIKEKLNNDEKLCAIIGIGSPLNKKKELENIPPFINYLKNNKIIDNYSWTIKLHTRSEGRMIIGGLPHTYEQNTKFYNEEKFKKIVSYSANDVEHPWSFLFKEITFKNANNETIYVGKGIKMILVPNIRFIIGEDKYKKLILENYFQELIDKNICILDKTSITKYTQDAIYFGTSGIYEIFHCEHSVKNQKISFPRLNFVNPDLDYIFSFSFYDLFEEIDERYYFMVIFPEDTRHAAYNVWYLGLPFYYQNKFVFNYDDKTIGIYDQEKKGDDSGNDEKGGNNGDTKKNGSSINVWRIVIEIIIVIILVVIAFFIGKKINEQRKKRANELRDNYDYTATEENNINGTEDNFLEN